MVALSVVGAMAFAAPAANAQDDTMAVAACTLVPGSVTGATTVHSVWNDLLLPPAGDPLGGWDPVTSLLDTDNGGFTFAGQALCGGLDVAGQPNPPGNGRPSPIVGLFNIAANGNYANLVCGTGTANGAATLTGAPLPGGIPPLTTGTITADFGLTFVAGVGKLSLVVTGGNFKTNLVAAGVVDGVNNNVTGGEGTGVIVITPTASNPPNAKPGLPVPPNVPCITGDVTQFNVNGAFEASLSD